MTKNTRKFITTLRQQFKAADNDTKIEIWDILTALRGPDNYDHDLKKATTGLVRKAVFGSIDLPMAIVTPRDFAVYVDKRTHSSGHFSNHAENAFNALGLKWDEVNIPKTKKKVKK